ncbi:TPA: ABC transporter ATP-binding protein, partial [Candidatus Bathyarchaeota archaeon]|nr:ABC transporter ATP-binding protein [Candidatus Bathyarchaeota archaeon]
MGDELLNIRGLRTYYFTRVGTMRAVDGVDLHVRKGETVGLVGESGSGKSTLGLSILRLVPPPGRIVGGEILFDGRDLLGLNDKEMLEVRGRRISMIFQDPMASLNPLMRIGDHLIE